MFIGRANNGRRPLFGRVWFPALYEAALDEQQVAARAALLQRIDDLKR